MGSQKLDMTERLNTHTYRQKADQWLPGPGGGGGRVLNGHRVSFWSDDNISVPDKAVAATAMQMN